MMDGVCARCRRNPTLSTMTGCLCGDCEDAIEGMTQAELDADSEARACPHRPDRGPVVTPASDAQQITVEEALQRVEAVAVSRAAVLDAWPECHARKCSGRHPSPDETFNIFMAKIGEALRFPETNWRYKPEVQP